MENKALSNELKLAEAALENKIEESSGQTFCLPAGKCSPEILFSPYWSFPCFMK